MVNSIYELPELYDLQYQGYDSDIKFMIELASRYAEGLPILEFACGTGRLTLRWAEEGYTVVGVDLSSAMLAHGRKKLETTKNGTRLRVKFEQGNMTNHVTGSKHNFVVVPFTSFLHLLSIEEQLNTLKNMHNQMQDDGRMIVDIFKPNTLWLARGVEKFKTPVLSREVKLQDGGTLIRQQFTKYDESTQIVEWTFIIDIYDLDGSHESQHIEKAKIRVIFPDQWRLMLKMAGFEIEHEYGDYQFSKFGVNSPRMLFVCRKS